MSPLPAELTMMMHDTIRIAPFAGRSGHNDLQFGTPVDHQCYIARANKKALNRSGEELISTVQVFMAVPETVVTADDEITMPDGSHPTIIEVLGGKDENGDPFWLEIRA